MQIPRGPGTGFLWDDRGPVVTNFHTAIFSPSGASAGSLVSGDVMVALNGKPLTSFDELLNALEQHQAGETVTLTILRENKRLEQPVRLSLPG